MGRNLRIDLRDKRLPGGRLDVSAGTTDPAERDARKQSVRALLERGERGLGIIARLRAGALTIESVHAAVTAMDLGQLEVEEPEPEPEPAIEEPEGPARIPVYLGAAINRFLLSVEGTTESTKTHEGYGVVCRQMETAFGVKRDPGSGRITHDVEVGSITAEAAAAWLHGKKQSTGGKPWAPRTQARAHAVAAQVWDVAMAADEENAERNETERTVARNPWRRIGHRKGVKPARVRKTRVEFLSRAEAARLLRTVKGTHLAAWVAVGIYAGLRAGEAAHMRLAIDVDLSAERLHVQPRKGRHAWHTKSDNSVRDVPIHPRLARWIRRHVEGGFAGEVYLFHPAVADRPITESTVQAWTADAFRRAGIRYGRKKDALTYHSLRHTFASWLTQRNVHPKKIAALMGDRVEVVMETYAHLVDSDLDAAIHEL